MVVRLLIHAEPVEASGHLVWWVESPDVPGFSGAADRLVEARVTSERAIRDLLTNQGVQESITFSYDLVPSATADEGVPVGRTGEGAAAPTSGSAAAEVSRVAPEAALVA